MQSNKLTMFGEVFDYTMVPHIEELDLNENDILFPDERDWKDCLNKFRKCTHLIELAIDEECITKDANQ